MNTVKDMFDRDQHAAIVKHSEVLKALEDTHSTISEAIPSAGSKDALIRLRLLRAETNKVLGNPVSVMVTFYMFVQPALRRLMGEIEIDSLLLQARCDSSLRKKAGARNTSVAFSPTTIQDNLP